MTQPKNYRQQAFVLPSIVLIASVILTITLALAQYVVASNALLRKSVYAQVAQTAAKSGIHYASEQVANEGIFEGTDEEFEIISNTRYRTTFEVSIEQDKGAGLNKRVVSIGRVYIGASTTPIVERTYRALVYSATPLTNPLVFRPMAWYDATDVSTLYTATSTKGNWSTVSSNSASYLNEVPDVALSSGLWGKDRVEMNGRYDTGIIFNVQNIPATATVTEAYMMFPKVASSILGYDDIPVTLRVIDPDAIGTSGTWSGPGATNQIKTIATLGDPISWQMPLQGAEPAITADFDLAEPPDVLGGLSDLRDYIQDIIEHPNFDNVNDVIAFKIDRNLDSKRNVYRTLKKEARLVIKYTTGTDTGIAHSANVVRWDDKSGYGFHLTSLTGRTGTYRNSYPTDASNMINEHPTVRLNGSSPSTKRLSSPSITLPETANGLTIIAAMLPNSGTTSNGSVIQVTGTPDDLEGTRTYAFRKASSGNTIDFRLSKTGTSGGPHVVSLASGFNGTARVFAGGIAFDEESCEENLLKAALDLSHDDTSGTPGFNFATTCPNASQRVSKSIQRDISVTVGDPGNVATNFSLGELIIYDHTLGCRQVQSVQKYLRNKWFNETFESPTMLSHIIECPRDPNPIF